MTTIGATSIVTPHDSVNSGKERDAMRPEGFHGSDSANGRVPDRRRRSGAAPSGAAASSATTVGLGRGDLAVLFVAAPGVGLVLGWAIPRVAGWASEQKWVPFGRVFEFIAVRQGTWATVLFLVLGLLAGLAFVGLALHESLRVTVSDGDVRLRIKGQNRTIQRGEVQDVFVDGKQLVLLDSDTRELARDTHEQSAARLADAFRAHGYPWREHDPHQGDYRRWVRGADGLPAGADAVLLARQKARDSGDPEDAAELKGELAVLGVVVREEGKRQHWRPTRS